MSARVLVTGGAGFIGSHVVDRLLRDGHAVRVIDNFATGRRENLASVGEDVEIVEGDLQSYERAHRALQGCEFVLHQAALPSVPRSVQDPLTTNASNVIATLNVLLAARDSGVRRVILASSSSVYGANPVTPKTEDLLPTPISPYAVTKLAAEGYCRSFHHVYGMETVALRYFNVFGPRQDPASQYSAVIPRFVTAALEGTSVTIFGDGEQSRDFTYISNVVDANLRALTAADAGGRTYNVACGRAITLNRVVEALAEISGRPLDAVREPPRPGDVRHSLADVGAAGRDLGYLPEVSFEEGLERTYEYMAERSSAGLRAR